MQHTLVAVFDNRNDAQQAMDELLASSFTSSQVRLSQGDTADAASSLDTPTMAAVDNDDDSISGSIRNFFSDIFGTDDSVHAHKYSAAVTRGHHVLTVGPVSEPEVERAADIVERFGPVDIDEKSSEWDGAAIIPDAITRRDTGALQGGQSLSFQSDDRQPFQQGNLQDPVPMGGTYQEPMGSGNLGLSMPSAARAQDATQQGSLQRGDMGAAGIAKTELKRPGVRVFSRDADTLANSPDALRGTDESAYRSHFDSSYGLQGGNYDDYAPAYGYGSSQAKSDKYLGRSWDDAESDIRSDWESRNANGTSTWDRMKAAIRHGWDRMTA